MPLVERFGDWKITDGSFDDPHMLQFDHRIEASAARDGTGLANVENNVKATCVITILKPEFGWTQVGNEWLYDPTRTGTDLESVWRNNLPDCVRHDKESLKSCFCNSATNPSTAYVGPEADILPSKIDALQWPSDTTELVSRFPPAGQYIIGPKFCSAYHLGNGYVGTAGHCLDRALVNGRLDELRVVFDWVGDVMSKKVFTTSEVFKIDRVVLCDTHGRAPSPIDSVETVMWSRRWDSSILKLEGTPKQLSHLGSAKYVTRPPRFGTAVYSIGCPLGAQLKVCTRAHVLRHCLVGEEENPFSQQIAGHGTYTTDLDQFEGNSGGPVFDANTGYVVGHTSSTQDAVAESDADSIESWTSEYAKRSKNYALAVEINQILKKQEPANRLYRIHPKFLRSLSGMPRESPLIKCTTVIGPSDYGPNRVVQIPGRYQAVFSRHSTNSKDVYLRNVTARVDRAALFMTSLTVLLSDYDTCALTVRFAGRVGILRKPDVSSTLVITSGAEVWKIRHLEFRRETRLRIPAGLDIWSVTLDLIARENEIPYTFLNASRGLIDWTKVRLEQPVHNPPLMVGLCLSLRRPSFPFPVSKTWPTLISDLGNNNPADAVLRWPEEIFEFATTAGGTSGILQTGGLSKEATEASKNDEARLWVWETAINRVWTNPRQSSQGLRDPIMDDIDGLLA